MKIIKYIFLIIWTLWSLNGIIRNFHHYKSYDWITAIFILSIPYIIMCFITYRINKCKTNKNEGNDNVPAITKSLYEPITKEDGISNEIKYSNSSDNDGINNQIIQTQYIESNNIIYHTNGTSISNEEMAYLIQTGCEEALQTQDKSSNPKFYRTDHEEELSLDFEMKYCHEIGNLTEEFESLYQRAYKTNSLEEKITLLNKSITAFEKAKKFCYSKGKGGTIYFQDTWEHLHNSHNQCFSYLEIIQDALEEAIYQRDEIIPQIIDAITTNDGILQKNIYKILPDIDKKLIQCTIRQLEYDSKISRVKKSNSYELHTI